MNTCFFSLEDHCHESYRVMLHLVVDLGDAGVALDWMSKAIDAGYSARKFQDLVAFQNLVDNLRHQQIVGKAQHPH